MGNLKVWEVSNLPKGTGQIWHQDWFQTQWLDTQTYAIVISLVKTVPWFLGVWEGLGSESQMGLRWDVGIGSRKPVNAINSLENLATIDGPWHRVWHQMDYVLNKCLRNEWMNEWAPFAEGAFIQSAFIVGLLCARSHIACVHTHNLCTYTQLPGRVWSGVAQQLRKVKTKRCVASVLRSQRWWWVQPVVPGKEARSMR